MTVGDVRQMSSICGLGAYGLIASINRSTVMAGKASGKSGSLVMNESELSKAFFPWVRHIPLITNAQTLHPIHIILCDNSGLIQDTKRVLPSHKRQHV